MQGNHLTGLSHQFNTDFLCDEKRNDRDLHRSWNDREQLSNTTLNTTSMTTIQHLMSEHCYGSISNSSTQPEENTAQEKYLTRLPGYNNTDQLCDRESQPTDLQESWPHKELLHNRPILINQGYKIIPTTHKEVYLLPRPLKAMAHRYRHTEKEAHLLSGPSELQPPDDSEAQKFKSSTQVWQPRQEYSRFTETEKAKFQTPSTYNDDRNFVQHNSVEKFSPNLVYLTKSDTSSFSDSIFSERREEIAEDVPAPAEDIPAPAPATTLETVEE